MLAINLADHVLPDPESNSNQIVQPQLLNGKPPPPQQLILSYSADQWEEFLKEWGHYQKTEYHLVTRLGGANDYGVDVACFVTDQCFQGEWDNFQCKHYNAPLTPKTAIEELGKLLWHVYNGNLTKPRRYYFFAPKDCGSSLKKLLLDSGKLKSSLEENWLRWCSKSISSKQEIYLSDEFKEFVDSFDFSMFQYKPSLQVIEEHEKTPYHVQRFFKVLEGRPLPQTPPSAYGGVETRYIEQLLEAYADHKKINVSEFDLSGDVGMSRHFSRQRESFYYAESLKLFARDSVPKGTFESLQDEMLSGVADICEDDFDSGYKRVREVTKHAQSLTFASNTLHQVMKVQDKRGMCHQLANDDKLMWVPKDA